MITVRPFRGLRPIPEKAAQVASPPYDVLDSEEAKEKAKNNPISFLHIIKSEIDLPPGTSVYDKTVYNQGVNNLQKLVKQGILIQEDKPCFYIYRMKMGNHEQAGLVAATSSEDYIQHKIKKHEHTKPAKESDRAHHILYMNAHCGPVIFMYHAREAIDRLIAEGMRISDPLYDLICDYNIQHTLYRISDPELIQKIIEVFKNVDALYIADGHHRSAAATRVMRFHRNRNPDHSGEESYNFFLAVLFPDSHMKVLDYNRAVKDLNGFSKETFFNKISEKFLVSPYIAPNGKLEKAYRPEKEHMFGMYIDGQWYKVTTTDAVKHSGDPVAILDVSILQNHLLGPILGIQDPRNDDRIHFIGGIRGLGELERLVDSGQYRVAFSMHPTGISQIMAVADANRVMPPKSTWFEPKLRSGLIIHTMD
ncbi:DUF1015 domain-containing protein [bacterium]|nr:DUF1015 domain-containing protein [bacterium]